MMRVAQGHHDEIISDFMSVVHTKFRPDEGFRNISKHVGSRVDVLCMEDMINSINKSADSNVAVIFPLEQVVDWKAGMSAFNPLRGNRKDFAYRIHTRAEEEHEVRTVKVDVYGCPHSSRPDKTVSLLKPSRQYPNFSDFYYTEPPSLTYG